MSENKEKLSALRHSAAHLLAAAVMKVRPDAKPTIGPAIDQGFYYDFEFKNPFTEDELAKVEQQMNAIVKDWNNFSKKEVSAEEAMELYANNPYKQELIEDLAKAGEKITLYQAGDFVDLCRGGHIEKPVSELKHFKLLSVAGAYWRGDENQPMLTRIYGTAFFSKKELENYLHQQAEAKKRDHKTLGPKLDLFSFSELVGGGLPLWSPKGTLLRNILDEFVWELRRAKGYQKVEIPHITKKELFEVSGHWEKFHDELFKINTREGHEFAMKPMNCPYHCQIFARKPHSYREMPQRFANTTMVYRDEQSGELSGLSRVRAITQDDAHVFCRLNQAREEMAKIWDIIDDFYAPVGFKMAVRLSLSDPKEPEKYLGKRSDWEFAEEELRQLAKDRGIKVEEIEGEAAFYGPKIDFMATDSLGREWQVATIQLDVNMPHRFELYCINEANEKEPIVMLHAAIMGSIERYLSILIEHYAGKFPVWLAPVQAKILPITDDQLKYADQVKDKLMANNVRVEVDERSATLGAKIRDAQLDQVPYMLVVGGREADANQVAVRSRDENDQRVMSVDEFSTQILQEIDNKS